MIAPTNTNRRWVQAAIHCALVLLVFVVPDLLITYLKPQRAETFYIGVYARTVCLLGVFYINYLWLIPESITRRPRRLWPFVLGNLVMMVIFLVFIYMVMKHMPHHHHPHRGHGGAPDMWRPLLKMLPMLVRDFLAIVLAIGLSVALKLSESWTALQHKNEEILAAQRNEEIKNLRSQLNPHSIFNTLNTIYALIDIDTEQAKKAVHKLSKLLRYMLYENPATVRLEQEVDFIRSYVDLMEMRLGPGKVDFVSDVKGSESAPVAPLLFLPVIENAFKHACNVTQECPIRITITADRGEVVCTTENPFALSGDDRPGGIGLENLRRRLKLLYADGATLSLSSADGVYRAGLIVPTSNPIAQS